MCEFDTLVFLAEGFYLNGIKRYSSFLLTNQMARWYIDHFEVMIECVVSSKDTRTSRLLARRDRERIRNLKRRSAPEEESDRDREILSRVGVGYFRSVRYRNKKVG